MRALLSTIGSRGDVQPLVALASELRCHRHTTRRRHCRLYRDRRPHPQRLTTASSGLEMQNASTTCSGTRSTRIGPQWAWPSSLTCAATSSPTGPGSQPTRCWRPGPIPPTTPCFRQAPGSCRMSVHCPPSWRRSSRSASHDLSLVDNEPDCLAIGEVNHQALFKRVAAVVHHGGAGTTTTAARAGAPQVVIPQVYDQHYWAQRIHHLGIGTAHAPGAPTTDSLTGALERSLQPDVAARAQSIATAVGRDGAQSAARRLMRADGGTRF
jgi:hypothetical protein